MRLAAILLVILTALPASAQSLNWFTPSGFDLTCYADQVCLREADCITASSVLVIRHYPQEGPTYFEMPDGVKTTGVLGVIDGRTGQTIMASGSPNGQQFYRIIVFGDGQFSVAVLNYQDKAKDQTYYGDCKERIS